MIQINMCISNGVNTIARFQTTNMSNHTSEQCIAGNIERYAQADISRSLIKLTTQFTVIHIELKQTMTWWKCHSSKVWRIPRWNNQTPIVGIDLDPSDDVLELIHTLTSIIRIFINVFSTKLTPLKAINQSPRSPSSLSVKARLSKNPFASPILANLADSFLASVEPEMNQSSSSTTPRQKTRFVVKSGIIESCKEYLDCAPKSDKVPVPVLSLLGRPRLMTFLTSRIYSYSSWSSFSLKQLPIILLMVKSVEDKTMKNTKNCKKKL